MIDLIPDPLTHRVIGAAMTVHRELGPGLTEAVYEKALSMELIELGVEFQCQVPIEVSYRGHSLGMGFRADMIVDQRLIIELKSVEKLLPVHSKQLLCYMRIAKLPLGLLMNFNEAALKEGMKRLALTLP